MNKRINIFLFIGAFVAAFTSTAQTTFYLDGYGRALTTTDKLNGELIDKDTSGNIPRKGVGGYTMFDLGINLEKDKAFSANAILRARNEFGLFWGDGTLLEFRQIRLEGVISKGIKYEIGDIDIKMTPYTVFNADEMYNDYEASVFGVRRGILEYENFNNGNNWRLQGVKSYTNILFNKGIEKIGLSGFGVRTQPANQVGQSDRIMAGFNTTVTQSENLKVGLNYVGINNLQISTSLVEYTNNVGTATLNYNRDLNDKLGVFLDGETGASSYRLARLQDNKEVTKQDYFYDSKLGVEYKPLQAKLSVGMKDVGADFSSPSAQTTRFNAGSLSKSFGTIPDTVGSSVGVTRYNTLYDRFTNEGAYNRNISTQLQNFAPQYTNINPYGTATPNRKGLTIGLSVGDEDSLFKASLSYDMMSEIRSDNNFERKTRDFVGIQGGVLFNVNQALGLKNDIVVTAGYRSENTTRGGVDKIDLSSAMIDLGVSYEVLKNFDLMVGYKSYTADGNEYITPLNQFNQYAALPTIVNFNFNEVITSFGLRFRFSEEAALTANLNLVSFTQNEKVADLDLTSENSSYDMSQLFISYIMKF